MPAIQIRCHTCGTRAEATLTHIEERDLRAQGYLRRYCRECRGNSLWDVLRPTGRLHLREVEEEVERALPRVLLIDDDQAILAVVGKALKQERFELETASSAREAASRLVRCEYDVILSDIRMPEFDGKQLFQFLDQHLPEHKERVIFLTGDTGNPETMAFLEEAQRPYLTKPIDFPALFELIRKNLPRPQGSEPG